jgi:integration host factor subunit beta
VTKADLVDEVVRVSKLSKKQAEVVVNTVFASIVEALQGDDKIELRGFGSFRVRRRRSRQGRNPKTGDRVAVPEKRIPYFKPGKELKDLINLEIDKAVAAAEQSLPQLDPPNLISNDE